MRRVMCNGLGRVCLPLVVVAAFAIVMVASGAFAGKPQPPQPTPCTGSPVVVVNNQSCGDTISILVQDSAAACEILCQMNRGTKGKSKPNPCSMTMIGWIGGTVVADPSAEDGFRFDPTTIVVAEVTAEGMQTNVCQIEANVGHFEGGLWYIPYTPIQIGQQ
jgi:hypothetical protein